MCNYSYSEWRERDEVLALVLTLCVLPVYFLLCLIIPVVEWVRRAEA